MEFTTGLGLEFSDSAEKTYTEAGALIYFGLYEFPTYIVEDSTAPALYEGTVTLEEFPFVYVVDQDPNGNQWMDGQGMTFENKLLTQTFTATCAASSDTDPWVWTAGTATITSPTVDLTAGEVNWALPENSDYSATLQTTQKYGPIVVWDSKWEFEYRTGWYASGAVPIWYAVSAEITVRQLLGYGGVDPGYNTPFEGQFFPKPGVAADQLQFYGTAIKPPAVARN